MIELLIAYGMQTIAWSENPYGTPKQEELFQIAIDAAKGEAERNIGINEDPRNFIQISNWKTNAEYFLEPFVARATATASFVKKADILEDWSVTTIGQGMSDKPYVIDEISKQRALENAMSQAKFYCDSTGEPQLLNVEYTVHGFIWWTEAKALFKCIR